MFKMSKLVCSRLEKIQRDFLWGGGNLEWKPHLVNWKTVCFEKYKGGLGVRNLSKLNQAFFVSGVGGLLMRGIHFGEW